MKRPHRCTTAPTLISPVIWGQSLIMKLLDSCCLSVLLQFYAAVSLNEPADEQPNKTHLLPVKCDFWNTGLCTFRRTTLKSPITTPIQILETLSVGSSQHVQACWRVVTSICRRSLNTASISVQSLFFLQQQKSSAAAPHLPEWLSPSAWNIHDLPTWIIRKHPPLFRGGSMKTVLQEMSLRWGVLSYTSCKVMLRRCREECRFKLHRSFKTEVLFGFPGYVTGLIWFWGKPLLTCSSWTYDIILPYCV